MGRWLLIGLSAVAGALAWPLAAPALAGTYTWQLPTGSAPSSSNPDHDTYGATPWSYVEAATASNAGPPPLVPTSFAPLGTYSTSIDGGLAGWEDNTDSDQPFVAVNRGGATLPGGSGLQVPPGQLALQPAGDRVVGIGWSSPLAGAETVTVTGTFQPDAPGSSCPGSQPSWVIEQDGLILTSEPPQGTAGAGGSQPFSATTTVNPGDTVFFVLGWYGVPAGFNPACTTAGVTLNIQAAATPPTVTLTSPSDGQSITAAQPKFAGTSGNQFGDSGTVKVRVWRGSANSGTPLEILTPDGSSGAYSAAPAPPLANGTYTAQAEQDDLAGDAAYSSPVTFSVHNVAPKVTLTPLGSRPLATATPVLQGTAGTAQDDSTSVVVAVWSGSSAQGQPVSSLTAARGPGGRWSVRVKPPLEDGRYTAIAVQSGPGGVYGVSKPETFRVKARPSPVIAGVPSLDRADQASIPILCTAFTGSCTGDVLVVTQRTLRPLPDGPSGHVRVLFGYVSIPAGQTSMVSRPVSAYVSRALRRAAPAKVEVIVKLEDSSGHALDAAAVAVLRLNP